jgi:hypothetical protein
VKDNVLASDEMPPVRIQVQPSLRYAGGLNFILYDCALAEQHLFIAADAHKRVERLLWFQFEGYLEGNKFTYEYQAADMLRLGAYDFIHDGNVTNIDDDLRENSETDAGHLVRFLKKQGYTLEGDTIFKRLVWLDEKKRSELMVIYSEDLQPMGYTVSDVLKADPAEGTLSTLMQGVHERALASFTVL